MNSQISLVQLTTCCHLYFFSCKERTVKFSKYTLYTTRIFDHVKTWCLVLGPIFYVLQAILGLIKVLVVKSDADGIQMHLKTIVEGLFKRQDDTNNHFKAKVLFFFRFLLKLDPCCKSCYHDEVQNYPFLIESLVKNMAMIFLRRLIHLLNYFFNVNNGVVPKL